MRLLGIDYGSKKIGLALAVNSYVSPLKTINNTSKENYEGDAPKYIAQIVSEEYIDKIIIGKNTTPFFNDFIFNLKSYISDIVEIVYVDEYKTTDTSIQKMIEFGIPRDKRQLDDAFAAAEILSIYLGSLKD